MTGVEPQSGFLKQGTDITVYTMCVVLHVRLLLICNLMWPMSFWVSLLPRLAGAVTWVCSIADQSGQP